MCKNCSNTSKLHQTNPEECRKIAAAYQRCKKEQFQRYRKAYKQRCVEKILELLGPRCAICGYDTNPDGLELDHITGLNGRLRAISPEQKLRDVRKHPEEYQILCGTCHRIKTRREARNNWQRDAQL